MAAQSLNNPFADYGKIVSGERFVGRQEEIRMINQRVLGTAYGNLAIMGLPRIGKSSLAWHAIMDRKEELLAAQTVPVFFATGPCDGSERFFMNMVNLLHDEMEIELDGGNEKYQRLAPKFIGQLKEKFDMNQVQSYFKLVKRCGYKTIFIFDEFDSVQSFFGMADFQFLRELSYNPDTHLCLVTCSRKAIEDIEVIDGAISNFAGIFTDLRLGMFSEEDVALYWEHFSSFWEVDERYKRAVAYFTGNHPCLMDMVNFGMFNQDITDGLFSRFDNVKLKLMETLDSMVKTIEKDHLLDPAIQLVVGPYYNAGQMQIEKLLKYGFIKKVAPAYKETLFDGMKIGPVWDTYCYMCFSDYSTLDFYRRYYANVPYVALWSETENLLRETVKEYLRLNFLEDWETGLANFLETNLPNPTFQIDRWRNNLEILRRNRDRMIQNFPMMNGCHLADFTLTSQIFDLFIRPGWSWFNAHIFIRGNYSEWNGKFDFLIRLRNPVAHNNVIGHMEEEMRVARDYCQEITACIREWQRNRGNGEGGHA